MTDLDKLLADIARQQMRFPTLETRNSDSLDFRDVSVWNAKAALEAAYEAGRLAGAGAGAAAAVPAAPAVPVVPPVPAAPVMPAPAATLTASQFCDGMMDIWDGDTHAQYDRWHNAVAVLDALGAHRVGKRMHQGDPSFLYRLPAGGHVMVTEEGGAASPVPPG